MGDLPADGPLRGVSRCVRQWAVGAVNMLYACELTDLSPWSGSHADFPNNGHARIAICLSL